MKRRPTARALEGALLAREIDMNSLGRDVMSTIRYGVRPGSVWRDTLLEVHFNLVIHHAHWENQNIPEACIESARRSVVREAERAAADARISA
jgi:hypothetical protein